MKKRIFIASHYMEIGGAEISLIGLLQAIDYSKYDLDLFIYRHSGELMRFIPKEVNLLPENILYAATEKPLGRVLLSKAWSIGVARLISKWKIRKYKKRHPSSDSFIDFQILENVLYKYLPDLYQYGEYDIALNFIADTALVLDKVKAKKAVTWIHSDYSSFQVDPELSLHWFNRVDYIAAISDAASATFVKVYPSLKEKMVTIENILSPDFVRSRAEMGMDENENENEKVVKILSIGRFCTAKNYDNVPEICKQVNDLLTKTKNYNENEVEKVSVKWYIIGWGSDEALIRQKIAEAGMEGSVILLGKKENPYPYIKACDIYCQPSRYEGKSVTVREAQMLCKPVVVTNYATASSQIRDGVDGVIVPLDNEGCAKGLAEFIRKKELQNKIIEYLQTHDYGNESEVEKLYILIP